jgi:hypothetical protein
MLIGKEGAITQEQADKMAKDAADAKRLKSLSNANLAGEIRREMRTTGKTNLLCFAIGLVTLLAFDDPKQPYDNGQQWYCQRTAPIRPKYGRVRKKTEIKKAAAKVA